MEYREYRPVERLAFCLECLWTLEGQARDLGGQTQPILPDGRTELIVHFGDPFERLENGAAERQAHIIFAGQLAHRLVLRPTGRIAVLGARFHPHGAAAFVQEPQGRLIGLTIEAASVSTSLAGAGRYVREHADSLAGAVLLMQRSLIERLSPVSIDARVARGVAAIDRCDGLIGIEDLAGSLDTTRRHLERLFRQHVGVSPKRLARITRFQRALTVLESAGTATGILAAHACGYADQAHFIREFRELAGCAPGQHLLERAELTGFFSSSPQRFGRQERP